MVRIKELITVQIEGTTQDEVQSKVNKYLSRGYVQIEEIYISSKSTDPYPFFTYVEKDGLTDKEGSIAQKEPPLLHLAILDLIPINGINATDLWRKAKEVYEAHTGKEYNVRIVERKVKELLKSYEDIAQCVKVGRNKVYQKKQK